MKVRVTFELDSIAEAEEVMQAVKLLKDKPYRLKGFGAPIVDRDVDGEVEVQDGGPLDPRDVPEPKDRQEPAAPRPNVSPGFTACQKIGGDTKTQLLTEVDHRDLHPSTIEIIAKRMKRTPDQTKALIQLLWNRGEIKYDGKEIYL